jgi:hypothetical protein
MTCRQWLWLPISKNDDRWATSNERPGLLNGPDGPLIGANVRRNIEEGRIIFAMGVFERV